MATDNAADFDLGPLSWVQGEIDQALARGLESLSAFRSSGKDVASLKHARTHIHQATGAIQMVGLDAVAAFTDEIERQLARLEELPTRDAQAACDTIDRGCKKLRIFLDELVNGAAPVPLKLFPEYEAMQRLRGVKAAAPTDLFYPDLAPRAPKLGAPQVIPPARLPSYMVKQRRLYQRGLLAWLRGDDEGARTMRDAVAGIESATTQQNLRAFWWTVGALLDALTDRGLETGFGVKQLAARVDLQIRRVVEGSAKVADRLRREVLYYVAISAPVAPSVQAVQKGFRLSGLIPSAEVLNADLVRIQPHLREARDQLAAAKDAWLKFTSGRAENLPKLKQTLTSVHKHVAEVGNGALMKLTASLVERLNKLPQTVPETLAMEYATGMLLAESALENYASLTAEFPKQVEAMLARLDAARAARPMTGAAAAPMLDEMSKRAQERLLLAQVGREIQANLRHMEQVLDAFFRDHAKRGELGTLAKDSQQIRGALKMLGLADAERLLGLCEKQIETYANPETPVSNDELELLAESLSGLGFYVEAVEQQRPDRERLIAPLLAKRLGEAPRAVDVDQSDTVEAAVIELRSALPSLVAEVHAAPTDSGARSALRSKLEDLRNDAELIGDPDLVAQAGAALSELEAGATASLAAAVTAIAATGGAAPAPAISAETQRLLATDATNLDAELLDIYLTEAGEVLDTVALHRRTLEENHGDREALRTVRRQFHTLKGSGRMVGLTELGEIAFEVEKILNRLLEEDRVVTPAVLAMVDVAERSFRQWVSELSRSGRVLADPAPLHAAINAIEAELPGGRESALTPTPPAPQVEASAPEPVAAPAPVATLSPPRDGLELVERELDSLLTDSASESMPLIELPEVGAEFADVGETPAVAESAPEPAMTEAASAPAEPEEITVGDVKLSAVLFNILGDEASQHLATLDRELEVLQFDTQQTPSAAMVRASHTLCGIHRTGGFPLVATTAKSLEQCLLGLQQKGPPLPSAAQPVLARAVEGLRLLVDRVKARAAFTSADAVEAQDIQHELEMLRQESAAEPIAADAEAQAERDAARDEHDEAPVRAAAPLSSVPESGSAMAPGDARESGIAPVVPIGAATMHVVATQPPSAAAGKAEPMIPAPAATSEVDVSLPLEDSLAEVRDEVDQDVLPIFLEEAAELFPQAGEQLRAWRRRPSDNESASQLRRTLHTFKGSARMAGAMRLGELTHRMESRLEGNPPSAPGTVALFDALDDDLDRVAFVLDALREGRTNVPLPWVAAAEAAPAEEKIPSVQPVAAPPASPSHRRRWRRKRRPSSKCPLPQRIRQSGRPPHRPLNPRPASAPNCACAPT